MLVGVRAFLSHPLQLSVSLSGNSNVTAFGDTVFAVKGAHEFVVRIDKCVKEHAFSFGVGHYSPSGGAKGGWRYKLRSSGIMAYGYGAAHSVLGRVMRPLVVGDHVTIRVRVATGSMRVALNGVWARKTVLPDVRVMSESDVYPVITLESAVAIAIMSQRHTADADSWLEMVSDEDAALMDCAVRVADAKRDATKEHDGGAAPVTDDGDSSGVATPVAPARRSDPLFAPAAATSAPAAAPATSSTPTKLSAAAASVAAASASKGSVEAAPAAAPAATLAAAAPASKDAVVAPSSSEMVAAASTKRALANSTSVAVSGATASSSSARAEEPAVVMTLPTSAKRARIDLDELHATAQQVGHELLEVTAMVKARREGEAAARRLLEERKEKTEQARADEEKKAPLRFPCVLPV